MKKLVLVLIVLIMIGTGFLSGCSQQQSTTKNANTITIKNFAFDPSTLTVTIGTNVTWINEDSAPHIIRSDDGIFESGTLNGGDSFKYTFNEAGTFNYSCTIHPSMKGKIIVE